MMKKNYSRPDIYFEDFALSTNIAAGCEITPVNNQADCGVQWGKSTLFTEIVTGCKKKVIDGDGAYNKLCYHNPTDTLNVFFS